jgi:hypothetical protein
MTAPRAARAGSVFFPASENGGANDHMVADFMIARLAKKF